MVYVDDVDVNQRFANRWSLWEFDALYGLGGSGKTSSLTIR